MAASAHGCKVMRRRGGHGPGLIGRTDCRLQVFGRNRSIKHAAFPSLLARRRTQGRFTSARPEVSDSIGVQNVGRGPCAVRTGRRELIDETQTLSLAG
jgi:hypothetical protein